MSIYKRKGIDWHKQHSKGMKGEREIARTLAQTLGHVDHHTGKRHHKEYDLTLTLKVEVKTHYNPKRYPTWPAEIIQNPDKGEVTINREADLLVSYDLLAGTAYAYNNKTLAAYLDNHKDQMKPFKRGTSLGILIPWECKEAGYLFSFQVQPTDIPLQDTNPIPAYQPLANDWFSDGFHTRVSSIAF